VHEPRLSTPKTAPSIEALQVGLEVYVEPLDATISGYLYRLLHQLPANTATARIRMDGYVQQESVDAPIPGQVDETDQAIFKVSADESQTAAEYSVEFNPGMPIPSCGEQRIEILSRYRRADPVNDVFPTAMPSAASLQHQIFFLREDLTPRQKEPPVRR